MPLIIIAPLAGFLLALSSVRTRRSAANLAQFAALVMLAASVLVAWGLAKTSTPYSHSYQYINLPVAFNGPANFQGFGIDIAFHVDHLTAFALIVVEVIAIAVLSWHQVMGRSEPGAARFYALVSALLFAFAGALVSWDLAALFAFWGMAGGITYLLLTHRWGSDEAAARARVALALPFLTDLSLLCGIAWLYARYGVNNFDTLIPILHTNPGWTVRSLVVAAALLLVGVAGRLALWPFNSWLTQTSTTAPPAASAIAQSAWSIVGIVVLYRFMPILFASNAQTLQVGMYACAASGAIAALATLAGNDPRRILTLLGSAVAAGGAAIVIHGFQSVTYTFAIAGLAAVIAVAPARAAAMLAMSSIANAMRTDDLAEMGDAWVKMRASAFTLGAAGLVLALGMAGSLAFAVSTRSYLAALLGEVILLVAVGVARVFLGASFGPLRRRRAFEPDRVREAASGSLGWPNLLVVVGAGLLVASAITAWLDFLDHHKHLELSPVSLVLWVVIALAGFFAAGLAYTRAKDGALAASAFAGDLVGTALAAVTVAVERFIVAPSTDFARRVDVWVPAGDGALGRFANATGRFAASGTRAPALPLVILFAVVLAVLVGLLVPGLVR